MLEEISKMIFSTELQRALLPVKIVFIILSSLALVVIIYFLFTTSYLTSLFLERREDSAHWRQTYSLKALKKRRTTRKKEKNLDNDFQKNPGKTEEEVNLKQGRIARTDWERILDKLNGKDELNYKLAFIDADKLFNQELKKQGKELSKETISNADDILKIKEILEKMLDNPKTILSQKRAKEFVNIYHKTLFKIMR
jgi:hypothetical protein